MRVRDKIIQKDSNDRNDSKDSTLGKNWYMNRLNDASTRLDGITLIGCEKHCLVE